MSDELAEWLRAQLDEDERLARHALEWAPSPWVGAFKQVTSEPEGSIKTVASTNSAQVSHHIERWEPEAVLAEVEAKGRLIDLHWHNVDRVDIAPFDPLTGLKREPSYDVTCHICGWVGERTTSTCLTLRLLAWPYRDRPGFRDEWRPE